jgi:uncharacterized protein
VQCPVCAVDLTMTERQGVEIDYCPKCRGVWLDRGELDKIIERAAGSPAPRPVAGEAYRPAPGYRPEYPPRREYDDDDDDYRRYHGRRRRGWLGEIFDFD